LKTKSNQSSNELPIGKVVGRRRLSPTTTLEDADRLLRTAWALRGTDRLVPRGLYRFETFEEAERWMIQMMARTHARRPSKTSPGSAAHPTMQRTKQTVRPSDHDDCEYLEQRLAEEQPSKSWLDRILGRSLRPK
jgi:hypothetical protein